MRGLRWLRGGPVALAIDPESGAHAGLLLVISGNGEGDEENDAGPDLGEWLERHDGRELGGPWDEWVRLRLKTVSE